MDLGLSRSLLLPSHEFDVFFLTQEGLSQRLERRRMLELDSQRTQEVVDFFWEKEFPITDEDLQNYYGHPTRLRKLKIISLQPTSFYNFLISGHKLPCRKFPALMAGIMMLMIEQKLIVCSLEFMQALKKISEEFEQDSLQMASNGFWNTNITVTPSEDLSAYWSLIFQLRDIISFTEAGKPLFDVTELTEAQKLFLHDLKDRKGSVGDLARTLCKIYRITTTITSTHDTQDQLHDLLAEFLVKLRELQKDKNLATIVPLGQSLAKAHQIYMRIFHLSKIQKQDSLLLGKHHFPLVEEMLTGIDEYLNGQIRLYNFLCEELEKLQRIPEWKKRINIPDLISYATFKETYKQAFPALFPINNVRSSMANTSSGRRAPPPSRYRRRGGHGRHKALSQPKSQIVTSLLEDRDKDIDVSNESVVTPIPLKSNPFTDKIQTLLRTSKHIKYLSRVTRWFHVPPDNLDRIRTFNDRKRRLYENLSGKELTQQWIHHGFSPMVDKFVLDPQFRPIYAKETERGLEVRACFKFADKSHSIGIIYYGIGDNGIYHRQFTPCTELQFTGKATIDTEEIFQELENTSSEILQELLEEGYQGDTVNWDSMLQTITVYDLKHQCEITLCPYCRC